MKIEFVAELPPSTGTWDQLRQQETAEFVAELKAHPMLWAPYPWPQSYPAARSAASRIRRGLVNVFGTGFEAVTRGEKLYVRYTGE